MSRLQLKHEILLPRGVDSFRKIRLKIAVALFTSEAKKQL